MSLTLTNGLASVSMCKDNYLATECLHSCFLYSGRSSRLLYYLSCNKNHETLTHILQGHLIRTYYKIEGSILFIWKGIYLWSFRPCWKFILLLLHWQFNWCSLSYYCMDCHFFAPSAATFVFFLSDIIL